MILGSSLVGAGLAGGGGGFGGAGFGGGGASGGGVVSGGGCCEYKIAELQELNVFKTEEPTPCKDKL